MEIATRIVLVTFFIPFFVTFLVSFFSKGPGTTKVIAAMLGSLAGYTGVLGLPSFPPANFNQYLFFILLIMGITGSGILYLKGNLQRFFIKLSGMALLSFLIINPLEAGLTSGQKVFFLLMIFLSGLLYEYIFTKAIEKNESFLIPSLITGILVIYSVIIFMSGSAFVAQINLIIAVTLIALLFVNFLKKVTPFNEGESFFYASFLALAWFMSYYLIEVPLSVLLLTVLSPLVLAINLINKTNIMKKWQLITINITLVSLPLLIAVVKTLSVYLANESYYF